MSDITIRMYIVNHCLLLTLGLCVFFINYCTSKTVARARYDNGRIKVEEFDGNEEFLDRSLASATFDNKINETGWAFLEIHSNEVESDEVHAYAAGYLEGYLTQSLIWMHYQNVVNGMCTDKEETCKKIDKYIDANEQWVEKMINSTAHVDPYWYQVKLLMKQLQGLSDGYASKVGKNSNQMLTYRNLLFMNMNGDIEDLMAAMGEDTKEFRDGHCSALIKILPDWSDVYTAQITWNSFQSMLRIQKKYVLKYKTLPSSGNTIKGHTMSFSSYPGQIQSGDDFYITSANLVSLETTIGNSNPDLWKYCSPVGQVLEFVRTMVANRLAGTAKSWVQIARKYNSGTYNNQWMVVDYKRFIPSDVGNLKPDFLWVMEQIPGTIEARDMTNFIKNQGYWPSYNLAYFPTIFNLSGGPEQVAKYGEWFTYDKNPRALIFKRDQGNVKNMDDMLYLMTYNDFKHDPLSRCECDPPYSAENAIAARNDLNLVNGTYPFHALSHRSHGATDAKITNSQLLKTYQFLSVSGPIHNETRGIPPFRWSETDFGVTTPHLGHPDLWKFKPLTHKWEWTNDV